MFDILTKVKQWVVGIFAIIGGIAVVWALKKDTRDVKEFKADLKKIKRDGKALDKKIDSRKAKATKLQHELDKTHQELKDFTAEVKKVKVEQKTTQQKVDYLKRLGGK